MRVAALVLTAIVAAPAIARADLHGRVVDDRGRPVTGATIDAGDLGTATSRGDGVFVLAAADGVTVSAIVHADDYLPTVVTLDGDDADVVLSAEATDGEVIHVSGAPPDHAEPTTYTLDASMVRSLPGGANDVLRAAQSLPGVGRVAFGLGGLVLRGASPSEAAVFLDGIEVPLAFHFGGVSSFYPSTLLDTLRVTPGGAEVEFGRVIGGVVALDSRAPRRDRVRVGAELGMIDVSAHAETPTPLGGALALGVRRSYVDAILAAVIPPEDQILPRYYDAQLRWDVPLARGTLTTLAFVSDDLVSIAPDGGGAVANGFVRAALRWRRVAGDTTWTVMPWGGANHIAVVTAPEDPNDIDYHRQPAGLRADARRATRWGEVAAGVDLQGARVTWPDRAVDDDEPVPATAPGWYADLGAWSEARWRIADGKLTLKPGLRADWSGLPRRATLSPHLVATHELTSWLTTREALSLHVRPGRGAAVFGDNEHDHLQRGFHGSLGAQVRAHDWRASATWFHAQWSGPRGEPEPYGDVALADDSILGVVFTNLVGDELDGVTTTRGRAHGLELSAQRRTDRWMIWLAYTYARSETHDWGSPHGWILAATDRTHDLSAVASVSLGRWQLGARVRVSTGTPYTISGDDPRGERLPAFRSLDVRVERRWQRSFGTIAAFLDVHNVTNAYNVEAKEVTLVTGEDTAIDDVRGAPILPFAGVSFTPPP